MKYRHALRLGLIVLAAAMGSFCSGCGSEPEREGPAAEADVDLSELIAIRDYDLNPRSGGYDMAVTRFYSRETGQEVHGIDLLMASDFSEGLAAAQQADGGKVGYVDTAGRVVIPFTYDSCGEPFCQGRAVVSMGPDPSDWVKGLIDKDGQWVVPAGKYDDLGRFREGRLAFRVGELWGLLDSQGREVVAPQFAEPPVFFSQLAATRTEQGELVYIDRDGRYFVRRWIVCNRKWVYQWKPCGNR